MGVTRSMALMEILNRSRITRPLQIVMQPSCERVLDAAGCEKRRHEV